MGWQPSERQLGFAEFSLVSQLFSHLTFSLQVITPLQPEKDSGRMRDSCMLISASSLRSGCRSKPQSSDGPR